MAGWDAIPRVGEDEKHLGSTINDLKQAVKLAFCFARETFTTLSSFIFFPDFEICEQTITCKKIL